MTPPRSALKLRDLLFPLGAIATGVALIPLGPRIFFAVSGFLQALPLPSLVWEAALGFANPFTALAIAILIGGFDSRRRILVAYLLVASLTATLLTTTIKELSGRRRPEWSIAMNEAREKAMRELAAECPTKYIPVERRDIWCGPRPDRLWFSVKDASFPSGHTSAAFVLAAFLSLCYPRFKPLWLFIAALSAAARVKSGHHYVEDVLVAAGLTWGLSQWIYTLKWPGGAALRIKRCFSGRPWFKAQDSHGLHA
ncbi:MAG: phosphatase PAP2 family protein [Candidatus Sumerlaeaceae bacterium]|nr:phosphatase PAP2 family protein [Candidatus Sumerlaeaceae bacterium]